MFLAEWLGRIAQRKYLNWIRQKRQARGVRLKSGKGVRLTTSFPSKMSGLFVIALELAFAGFLLFGLGKPSAREPALEIWALRGVGLVIGGFALVCLLDTVNMWVLVTEEGVMRQNFYWQRTFIRWHEIKRIEYNQTDEFWISAGAGRRLVVSLSLNGLEDLREYAEKHLSGRLAKEIANLVEGG